MEFGRDDGGKSRAAGRGEGRRASERGIRRSEEKRERLTEEGHERVDERRVAVEEEEDRRPGHLALPEQVDLLWEGEEVLE